MRFIRTAAICAATILASACAYQSEISYQQGQTLVDFTESMAKELQAGLDKYSNALYSKQLTHNGMHVYRTSIVPRAGLLAIHKSYKNYCDGLGGQYQDGYCYSGRENNALFYAHTAVIGEYAGHPDVEIVLYQPGNSGTKPVLERAIAHGYLSAEEKVRQLREAVSLRSKVEAERANIESHAQRVKQRTVQAGTRICAISGGYRSFCQKYSACFTEAYNKENDRIKVSVDGKTFWQSASNWYACGN